MNYHKNIAQKTNAKLRENDEKNKQYYKIFIDMFFTKI